MTVKKKIIGTMCIIGISATMIVQDYYPVYANGLDQSVSVLSTGVETVSIKEQREFRATWISTVYNLDWPSQKGLTKEQQQQEFRILLDELQQAGLNAVIVQIKPTADSFYPSQYGPWSEYLTGVQGQDPGYDPLAFMIEEAHNRNMEFHAWVNPYRISVKDNKEALASNHPARKNPHWLVSYGGQLYYNPGIPEARQFVIDSILEVVKNYDIDGIHLDDYFYPYPVKGVDFPDEAFYSMYKRTPGETREQWRRNNINDFIEKLSKAIKEEKKHVKLGVSPFGIWRNQSQDPLGSDTKGSITSYDSLYADTKLWVEKGWLDYIAPQVYWHFGYEPAAYEKLINWWGNITKDKDIHLYIGQAAYKVAEGDNPWGNPAEIPNQIAYNRNHPHVHGSILFRAKSIISNPLGLKDQLKTNIYQKPSIIPQMPWLNQEGTIHTLEYSQSIKKGDHLELQWRSAANSQEQYYVIYRSEGDHVPYEELKKSENILKIVKRKGNDLHSFTDETRLSDKKYTYGIVPMDRLHCEGALYIINQ